MQCEKGDAIVLYCIFYKKKKSLETLQTYSSYHTRACKQQEAQLVLG